MIQPALGLAESFETVYFIADYHALTTMRDAAEVRKRTLEVAATWMALGLDPETSVLYCQSDLPDVCELTWVLSCSTAKGLCNRSHAYKAAVAENEHAGRDADAGVNMGLFNYPILMAADILIHDADVVPVGHDQQQHIEITRDIASAFNGAYGPVLTVPEGVVDQEVGTIPGIDGRKMSKSYANDIPVLAPLDELRARVMRIVTDTRPPDEPKDPDDILIYQLYRHMASAEEAANMAERFRSGDLGYGDAKQLLLDVLDRRYETARMRFADLMRDLRFIQDVLDDGAAKARDTSHPVLERVRAAVGVRPAPAGSNH